jgi:hypothetical protein
LLYRERLFELLVLTAPRMPSIRNKRCTCGVSEA